jgi:hypothetical protein
MPSNAPTVFGFTDLDHRVPAVDEVVTARHERCLVGQQKADEWRDLIRLAESAQRMPAYECLPEFCRKICQQRRLDVRRTRHRLGHDRQAEPLT